MRNPEGQQKDESREVYIRRISKFPTLHPSTILRVVFQKVNVVLCCGKLPLFAIKYPLSPHFQLWCKAMNMQHFVRFHLKMFSLLGYKSGKHS